ncbi:alpha/beta hydrolase [Staphylococcus chromogenes]|uniref:alpha/beta hydrolase n=1 Tax=Staphylococcus chromogenes TaxID=46126 RepID=UPI000D1B48FC|nr:alpha/beta fold hydrolase [Staphylococcus chromogenes]PTG01493.1 alpha/beta hydrolase [Staphylococcus chromogenes]
MEQFFYGDNVAQHYDVYLSDTMTNPTWIVLVHGGYWREKFDKHMMDPMIDALSEEGYGIINIEYRRGPEHPWSTPSEDIHAALKHFKSSKFAPDKCIGLGHSVGGQLVLLNHKDFDAVVALAPVTDVLYTLHHQLGQNAATEYFDTRDTNILKTASPITQLPIETETLIIHGYNDTSVHIDTSLSLVHENYHKGEYITFYALPFLDHLECINPRGTHFPLLCAWLKQFSLS